MRTFVSEITTKARVRSRITKRGENKMKTFKSIKIKDVIGSSKLIIEVPHQRPASLYDTNLKMTDFISESSNQRLRDSLRDLNHSEVITTLGQLLEVYNNRCNFHQGYRKQILIKNWASANLTDAQYLSLFGERKSKDNG